MPPIHITRSVAIDPRHLEESFIRAAGPGGQNVNKLSTAVQLRFAAAAAGLPPDIYDRLRTLAGQRMTQDGVLVITAQRFRTQERNRQDALDRLVALVRQATERPTPRRATRPTLGSKTRRLDAKKTRAGIKRMRRSPGDE